MAHCYICERGMDHLDLDVRDMKTRPCSTCEAIIAELVQEQDSDTTFNFIESTLDDYNEELGKRVDTRPPYLGDS